LVKTETAFAIQKKFLNTCSWHLPMMMMIIIIVIITITIITFVAIRVSNQ